MIHRFPRGMRLKRGVLAVAWVFILGVTCCGLPGESIGSSRPQPALRNAGDDLFAQDRIVELRIEVASRGVKSLRKDPRKKVLAVLSEGGRRYEQVSLHLKGSVGSFRKLDDKPSFTLWFNLNDSESRFHGLREIHLNNSVEDPSLLNEELGGEWFRSAGIPAPRVTHARVTMNGRPLGLYVLKEGFTEEFLARSFRDPHGNLYEPDAGHDIDSGMKLNSGVDGDQSDRQRLADAVAETSPERRWDRLGEVLDRDKVIEFMAMEVMIGHRDGYTVARNNFRLYHDLDSNRFLFLPHGMDQLLGRADFPWRPSMGGLVARRIVETPQGRRRYEESFRRLFRDNYRMEEMTNRVWRIVDSLAGGLSFEEFSHLKREADTVTGRIAERRADLERQLNQEEEMPIKFEGNRAKLTGWHGDGLINGMMIDKVRIDSGGMALRITSAGGGAAGWTTRAILGRGRYRFVARCKILNVNALSVGKRQGAGIRIGGQVRTGADLLGSSDWKELSADVQVAKDYETVEFKCELRAQSGEAWFDEESLKLEKLEN